MFIPRAILNAFLIALLASSTLARPQGNDSSDPGKKAAHDADELASSVVHCSMDHSDNIAFITCLEKVFHDFDSDDDGSHE
ncbi:hypothetical protein CVT25_010537 [Psilocybe cyanescens]|uniref:Uncharacterized protein n=1 Tax=Psilocybe cyanescens TaxID=93625 RepID=A0A409XGT5_PSICY|nr:hypothetical protein CVT25_010537 [Psilocybe cyanescens]